MITSNYFGSWWYVIHLISEVPVRIKPLLDNYLIILVDFGNVRVGFYIEILRFYFIVKYLLLLEFIIKSIVFG